MGSRSNKLLIVGIIISFILVITGFFLSVAWFPIQDIDIMSRAELLAFQKEFALNYPLGLVIYYVGIVLFLVCIALLIVKTVKKKHN